MNALELLEALPVMLWTARADGVWTHVNARWAAYTGFEGDAPGYGFEAALHPDDVAPTVARWTESVQTGTPYRAEYRLRRADGLYRWHLTQGARAARPDADMVWAGACTDIHDQKLAEQAILATREAAVRALGLALEARDHETKGHTDRVTALALRLGLAAGLGPNRLEALRLGAYLHDIGKISVPDAILLKPGPLTPEERAEMQRHVVLGEHFSAALGFLSEEVLEVIRGHHERWDGSGYPAGLVAAEIPLSARIFALADVYDALVSERPYKRAWTQEAAVAEVLAQAGQQFDPALTRIFVDLMEAQTEPVSEVATFVSTVSPGISDAVLLQALHEAGVSVLITDAEQRLVYVNPAFCRTTGYEPQDVIGRNPRFLQGPGTDPNEKRKLREALAAAQPVRQLILNYSRTGEKLWFEMHITPLFAQGRLAYFMAVQNDSSRQVADQQHLEWTATHDTLTGLLNRASLNQMFTSVPGPSALIFMDLDNIKGINDRYGHLVGDRVIREVAGHLMALVPSGGQAFRLGGDEFLLLFPFEGDGEADRCVLRLREALAGIVTGDGALIASFGIASFPQDGQDLWALMSLADGRMYQEKLGHSNRRGSSTLRATDWLKDGV